jgi:predicted DCC family thiol-disulfide oxidoreductase YuxK
MTKALQRWNAYWFRHSALADLAICRIVIVTFQLFLLVTNDTYNYRALSSVSALPETLYDPLPVLRLVTWPLGWGYRPSIEFLGAVYSITLLAGVLALIGFKTNLSLFIFAVGNIVLQAYLYSFGDFHHPEGLMMITLVVLALSPTGRALSVDDLRRRIQFNVQRRKFETFSIVDERSAVARWPLLLIQWMFALIYLSSATIKLTISGLDWLNGYTLQYYLLKDGLRYNIPLGSWLGQFHLLAWLISWLALTFEVSFFLVLVFPVLIWVFIPMGTLFHTGIFLTQGAYFFQYVAIYAVFIPWILLLKALSSRLKCLHLAKKVEIFFDGRCPLCVRSMTILCYFDWFDRLAYADLERHWPRLAESHPEIPLENCRRDMHVIQANGSVQKGFFAWRVIMRHLPPLWPLLIIFHFPLASTIGPKIYRLIASKRLRVFSCSDENCVLHLDSQ